MGLLNFLTFQLYISFLVISWSIKKQKFKLHILWQQRNRKMESQKITFKEIVMPSLILIVEG